MSFFKKDKKSKTKKTPRETSSDALEQGRVENIQLVSVQILFKDCL